VKQGEPAGSAEGVAVFRAIETGRPAGERLFHDPHAGELLTAGARAAVALLRVPLLGPTLLAVADRIAYGQRAFVLARTALIDEALVAALDRGARQVLILGAGYDSRAYRIPGIARVRVFEVDHPDTQARKRALLERALGRLPDHVSFVPLDFNRQSLGDRIPEAGFQPGAPAFVIWEGVTEYLKGAAVDATLRFLARAVAPGGGLAFTYLDRGLLDGTRSFRGGGRHLAMMRWMGEPFTFGIDPRMLGAYLAGRGFELLEDAGAEELARRYFRPRGRRDRCNDYQRIALARVTGAPRQPGTTP
jgi:methyltransferase (TIGR00027 family)